jgi:prepilin-type N-terminal cleavage/methylation domain-containing protein
LAFLRPSPYSTARTAPTAPGGSQGSVRARSGQRAFTLIELMMVVVIIGVLAVAAAPSMRLSTYERHAYNDAGGIMQVFRAAHARAVAYSLPVIVTMSANGTADRGTFLTYIANNPLGTGLVVTCKSPFVWAPAAGNANLTNVDGFTVNGLPGTAEVDANIQTVLNYYDTAATGGPHMGFIALGYMCFTPLGRSYVNAAPTSTAVFDGALPNLYPLEALVTRGVGTGTGAGAINRSVFVLPDGSSRVFSHLW